MNIEETPKKKSLVIRFIKSITLILFPGIRLLKINTQLKRINKMYNHSWFLRQRIRNTIVSIVVSSPFILAMLLSLRIAQKAENFWKNLDLFWLNLKAFEISKALGQFKQTFFKDEDFLERFNLILSIGGTGIILTVVLGSIVLYLHPLINDTKKLYILLQKNGIIDKEDNSRLVLSTPLGFLIDITGFNPREIKDSDRIWTSMNLRINDWAQDENQMSIVFFKKAYQLKPKYIYSFKK